MPWILSSVVPCLMMAPRAPSSARSHRQGGLISHHPVATLPSGVQLWPVAYSAIRPWLQSHGVLLLHRIFSAIASCSHGPGAAAWRPHFAALTARLASDLARRLTVESWRYYPACAGWAASVVGSSALACGSDQVALGLHSLVSARAGVCVCARSSQYSTKSCLQLQCRLYRDYLSALSSNLSRKPDGTTWTAKHTTLMGSAGPGTTALAGWLYARAT